MPTTLVIGFDSAWSGNNSGAIVGVLKRGDGSCEPLGGPLSANFDQATTQINAWKKDHDLTATLILIDQPIIVENKSGQRDVENLVSSTVGKRYGGVQPANKGKVEMFGKGAPILKFLDDHYACLDPTKFTQSQLATWVIETYPVLTMIALNWLLADNHPNPRQTRRLPKYNPANRKFSPYDWEFVCEHAAKAFEQMGMQHLAEWIINNPLPEKRGERKKLQDRLDACLCLLVGLYLIEGRECLMIGNMESGYMVIPHGMQLHDELVARCEDTGRRHADWVRKLKF
jgi:predicted RNase H-like nuclease